jgi:hypothetical protein
MLSAQLIQNNPHSLSELDTFYLSSWNSTMVLQKCALLMYSLQRDGVEKRYYKILKIMPCVSSAVFFVPDKLLRLEANADWSDKAHVCPPPLIQYRTVLTKEEALSPIPTYNDRQLPPPPTINLARPHRSISPPVTGNTTKPSINYSSTNVTFREC